ncbi:MAG: hypothetical protein ACE5G5_01260 [Candidatus Methylomirabilales bacterium]
MMTWINFSTSLPLHEPPPGRGRQRAGWLAPVLLVVFVAAWPVACLEAASLEGVLYLSTTGDRSGEVIWGAGEEVRLLKPEFARERDELRRRILPRIRDADRRADTALVELLRSPIDERRERERTYREAEDRRRSERREYEAVMDALISKYTVASAKADPEGRFRFDNIPAGTFLVYARMVMREMGLFYHWLVGVKMGEAPIAVELSTKNAATLYY